MPKDIKREFLTGPRKSSTKSWRKLNEVMADDGPVPKDLGSVGAHDAKTAQSDSDTSNEMSYEDVCAMHWKGYKLGCAGRIEPVTCAACNSGVLDTGAAHASCCALGEATRGHNAVSSLIHAAAQQCDHTSEMEVPGLIPGTDLRPADVLTSALGNAYTALDVSICSPHTLEAGTDCTQSRVEAKLEHYGPTWLPSSVRTSPTPRSCGVPMGDLTLTR